MPEFISLLIPILISYFLGAIPSAYWLGKLTRGIDIREYGSGNTGATNAIRILGKPMGILTLFLDMGKGWLAVSLAKNYFDITQDWLLLLVGLTAVIGHIYTIFLRFKGGKGVATTFGIFLAFTPLATLYAILIWFIIVGISRYVSLGSIISGFAFPILIYILYANITYTFLGIILSGFILYRHLGNIQRLILGKENKISF